MTTQRQQFWFQPRIQANLLQSKLRVSFLRVELKFKIHDIPKRKKCFHLHTSFCNSGGIFSNTEFRLCTAHVKMRRLAYRSAHVTIFLTENANVFWNSSARTKKYEKKQCFSIAHISLTILQMFLGLMMLWMRCMLTKQVCRYLLLMFVYKNQLDLILGGYFQIFCFDCLIDLYWRENKEISFL